MSTFDEIKLFLKLRPIIKQIQKEAHMKLSVNVVSQTLLLLGQAISAAEPYLSPKGRAISAGVLGVVQAVVSLAAHFSDVPDTSTNHDE